MKRGTFIISLDFELHWGGIELWNAKSKADYFKNTINCIPLMLDLFSNNDIRATWATVGFLFSKNKQQLINFSPKLKPTYKNNKLSSYNIIDKIGENELQDPLHFAPSLINIILNTPGQELASHTFSHYYCNEKGQTLEQFDKDLRSMQKIAYENFGIMLKSLVFPRNQFNKSYLQVARKNGIKVVRSNPDTWIWNNNIKKASSILRAIDTLMPISKSTSYEKTITQEGIILLPASRFFRTYKEKEKIIQDIKIHRIKTEMTYAAKHMQNYHLWWHPHNMADNVHKNLIQLDDIICHFKFLQNKYGFTSANMGDFDMK